jgi:hypothetical protein
MAERVVDKERANFCEYFALAGDRPSASAKGQDSARDKLEALFQKKRS